MFGVVFSVDFLLSAKGFWLVDVLEAYLPLNSAAAAAAQLQAITPFWLIDSKQETYVFTAASVAVFLLYIAGICVLPRRISFRFIWLSTALLGIAYLCMPIVTSQDIFSYIAYARMGVIYHLNPLTTLPTAIQNDIVYPFLYWINQPSAYGPTWAIITGFLQWLAVGLGFTHLFSMELLLRLFGLSMHLGSVWLIWSISGRLQGGKSVYTPALAKRGQQRRLFATLMFAWNPFLLLEACVNAHNDTTILFLILLALWFLLPREQGMRHRYLCAVALLAVAACLKITMVILFPGLLLFLWTRQAGQRQYLQGIKRVAASTGVYLGIVILLYAPFWEHGDVLHLLIVSPGTTHEANSLYEVVMRVYTSITGVYVAPSTAPGSPVEQITHNISLLLFGALYAYFCIRPLIHTDTLNTLPALIRWLAAVWLFYCLVGSPWFWPWYVITLLGLLSLIVADNREDGQRLPLLGSFNVTLFALLMTLTMFSLYIFSAWTLGFYPVMPNSPLSDYDLSYGASFQWRYLSGLLIWSLPFLTVIVPPLWHRLHRHIPQQASVSPARRPERVLHGR